MSGNNDFIQSVLPEMAACPVEPPPSELMGWPELWETYGSNFMTFSILSLSFDQLAEIVRQEGKDTRDGLLRIAGSRLSPLLDNTSCKYKADGNRMIIVCRETEVQTVSGIARLLTTILTGEYVLKGTRYELTVRVGASIAAELGNSWITILAQAEQAMNEVAPGSQERFILYEQEKKDADEEPQLHGSDLKQAIERNELVLFYQPRIDLLSGGLKGMEALVRWDHPQYGRIMPNRFIELAEKSGLIDDLGRWVLEEACRQARFWSLRQQQPFRMSVNVSPHQLQPGLIDAVSAALQQHNLDGAFLELEITESAMVRNMKEAVPLLQEVKTYGVSISIDDFGRGYTSVQYLELFPADCLKIDRSFLNRNLKQQKKIISAIIMLGRRFGLEVVGEGVETIEQLKLLRDLECDSGQGYLFSKPVDSDTFEHKFFPS
ncbi:hypothetical protein C2I18_11455 [Paenibacillus sp. PK3_47]|uniref:putative bifunctional diguanylate cyclase/phosphodiesterase n=1 Tax=Paenibacillus sp. PK3_47 TaxID=2072642 RepID=UPI00201DB472|nr:GGDEF domain-containing phosphodiesterase [Paenibacillus sp. PK3_47]UQZ34090.1 hypothetical protein C2I18_11455 [Paenibacillus sp. PK3_47]